MRVLRSTLAFGAVLGLLSACGGPDVTDEGDVVDQPEATAATTAEPEAEATPTAAANLDFAALEDREDPERLLRFYTEAVRAGDWEAAARAWSSDAEVNAVTLRQQYGSGKPPEIAIGKGDSESAAGTLFYEAPIVITFSDGTQPERRGMIVLRRANDVPGASQEQLNWRIERSSVLTPE